MEIAKWHQTKWLVGSSCTFLIPSLYVYRKNKCYSLILVGTSLFSINHWRKAENGLRRLLDIIYASFSFTTFLILGINVLQNRWYGYTGLAAIFYCYKMSHHVYQMKGPNSNWYIYHFFFHVLMTLELLLTFRKIK